MDHAPSLGGCFPSLAPEVPALRTSIQPEQGWDAHVLFLGGAVARIPRRLDLQPAMLREGHLLAMVGPRLPGLVPEVLLQCSVHGSLLVQRLHGAALVIADLEDEQLATISADLASAFLALWSTPVDELGGAHLPASDIREMLDDFGARVAPLVGDPRASRLLERARDRLVDTAPPPVLIHADIGPAHLLHDEGRITGILDWTDARLGDPAQDLAHLLHAAGGRLRAPLVEALDLDAGTVDRAALFHALGPWWEVVHGLDHDRPELVTSGLAGIRSRLP